MCKRVRFVALAVFAGACVWPSLAADEPPQTRSCWLRDIASPAPKTIYALCEQGSLRISTDGGTTWTAKDTGAKGSLRAMAFLDVNRGLVVGDDGIIMSTSDGAKNWTAMQSGTLKKLMDIAFVGN